MDQDQDKEVHTYTCINCNRIVVRTNTLAERTIKIEINIRTEHQQQLGQDLVTSSHCTSHSRHVPDSTSTSSSETHPLNSSQSPSPETLTLVEILTYAFELNQSAIDLLIALNSNGGSSLCDTCSGYLGNLYKARKEFLSLTNKKSLLFGIIADKRHNVPCRPTEADGQQAENRRDPDPPRPPAAPPIRQKQKLDRRKSLIRSGTKKTKLCSSREDKDDEARVHAAAAAEQLPMELDADKDFNDCDISPESPPSPNHDDRIPLPLAENKLKTAIVKLTRLASPTTPPAKVLLSTIAKIHPDKDKKLKSKPNKFRSDPCPSCGNTFTSTAVLKKHMEIEACKKKETSTTHAHSRYNFTCPICGNPNLSPGGHRLEEHLRKHMSAEEKAAELICCEVRYDTLKNLHIHRKSKLCTRLKVPLILNKPSTKKTCNCPHCGKTISSVVPNALQHHIDLIHNFSSRFICSICGKPAHSQKAREEHELTHCSAEERAAFVSSRGGARRPHLCPICGKSFIKKYHLTTHTKTIHKPTPVEITSDGTIATATTMATTTMSTSMGMGELGDNNNEYFVDELISSDHFGFECKKFDDEGELVDDFQLI